MAPFGAIPVSALFLFAMLHHDMIMMMVPAMVAMPTTIHVVMAVLDEDRLGIGNRRRRDRNRTGCGNNISKLLHGVLLH